jgi:hypothetical protein
MFYFYSLNHKLYPLITFSLDLEKFVFNFGLRIKSKQYPDVISKR